LANEGGRGLVHTRLPVAGLSLPFFCSRLRGGVPWILVAPSQVHRKPSPQEASLRACNLPSLGSQPESHRLVALARSHTSFSWCQAKCVPESLLVLQTEYFWV
jgi:hypothetical protein